MPMLHDPAVRDAVRQRIQSLSPDAKRAWGQMSVDQMLWHCGEVIDASLGRTQHAPTKRPLPDALLKMLVLTLPWPKGAPTHPDFMTGERRDFEAEKARLVRLIDEFAAHPLAGPWGESPGFGKATGTEWSRFQVKHLGHHLKQFGA